METEIHVFVDKADGPETVGLVIIGASIVEYEGDELTPCCRMSAGQARMLALSLAACADRLEGNCRD